MTGRIKFAALLAVAAGMLGTVAGAAGAAGSSTPASKPAARSAASKAAARRGALLRQANFKTVAGAAAYFRAIGVDPRGLVIQRAARNYAGPNCPGTGWACVSTAHPVVQIARVGGKNTFFCTSGHCAVVQLTARGVAGSSRSLTASAPTKTNNAVCVKNGSGSTTGLGQACSISQSSATNNNQAVVYENAGKMSGLTQTTSFTASIIQQATGASNSNTACVFQAIAMDGSAIVSGKKNTGANAALEAHQSVKINQDTSGSGTNNADQSANSNGLCNPTDSTGLNQSQTLTSTVSASGPIVQNENAANGGPNVFLDVEQNQGSTGFGHATGPGNVTFTQNNSLTALASTSATSGSTSCPTVVCQTQSSLATGSALAGGILATVNQYSGGTGPANALTAKAAQTETQCEDAVAPPNTPVCPTTADPPSSYTPMQAQYGPIGSTGGPGTKGQRTLAKTGKDASVQSGGNPNDVFTISQSSTQSNDTQNSDQQKNDVEAVCQTPGDCTANQTTSVNGNTTTNNQSGQNVSTSTTCSGSTCTGTTPPGIKFDGSPGTNAPPSTLGPYNMTAFGPDSQPACPADGHVVTGVTDPAGTIGFSSGLSHDLATVSCWATWSHGYTGDVYDDSTTNTGAATVPAQITITLPSGTNAFYFYAEPVQFAILTVTATAQNGTTSGAVSVNGEGGAKYFGFYGTGGMTVSSITVTSSDNFGFAVGEFGINTTPPVIP
jgi:hypothetical protein